MHFIRTKYNMLATSLLRASFNLTSYYRKIEPIVNENKVKFVAGRVSLASDLLFSQEINF